MEKEERKAIKKFNQFENRKSEKSLRKQQQNEVRKQDKENSKSMPWQIKKALSTSDKKRQQEKQKLQHSLKGLDVRYSNVDLADENDRISSDDLQLQKNPVFHRVVLNERSFSIDDIKKITFEGSYDYDVPFLGLPEIAFFGRSNVGKSSLLNCLAGKTQKPVAIVSKTPGRTRGVNLFKVHDSNGPVAVLVDLPGYGYAKMGDDLQAHVGRIVKNFLRERPSLKLALLLVDSRRSPQESDGAMLEYFRVAQIPILAIATKIDKVPLKDIDSQLDQLQTYCGFPEGQPVPFSSMTGFNKRVVWTAIRDACVGIVEQL